MEDQPSGKNSQAEDPGDSLTEPNSSAALELPTGDISSTGSRQQQKIKMNNETLAAPSTVRLTQQQGVLKTGEKKEGLRRSERIKARSS